MFLSALRKCLSPKASVRSRPGHGRRLRLESLEDRAVPATFTVNPGGSIQAALNAAAASPGADTVLVNAGTYTEALTINDSSPVTLTANGAVTLRSPATLTSVTLGSDNVGAALIDIYSSKVTVDSLTVDGANAPSNLSAGIRVIEGGSATIKNNTVANLNTTADQAFGIGIQVGSSRGGGSAGTAKVNNNTIFGYFGAGVLVDGSLASASVKGNTITGRGTANNGISQYGVQVSRGATSRVENNTISGNDIDGAVPGGSNPNPTSAGIFFYQDSAKHSVAARNNISGNDDGILVQESNGTSAGAIEVVNNDVHDNNGYAGIVVQLSSYVEVENNDVFNNTSFNGIALDRSNYCNVENNDIHNNVNADGIYVFQGNNNTLNCNDSFSNGFNGIFLEQSTNNLVWNNSTHGNAQNGIKVLGGSSNDLWLGDSVNNIQDGILLQDTTGNTVVGNALLSNGGYGLRLVNAHNTFIAFNLITGNNAGAIFIDSNSTGTVQIDNRTDTPPSKEGTTGSAGTSSHYTCAHANADDDVAGLDN
jgi:parallel beta-helix repeat protein